MTSPPLESPYESEAVNIRANQCFIITSEIVDWKKTSFNNIEKITFEDINDFLIMKGMLFCEYQFRNINNIPFVSPLPNPRPLNSPPRIRRQLAIRSRTQPIQTQTSDT